MNPSNIAPHSVEAEESIIGSFLLDEKKRFSILEKIKPEHFYVRDIGEIYKIIQRMSAEDRRIDMVSLSDAMSKENQDDSAFIYLGQIQRNVPSSANVEEYCDIVLDRYNGRKLLDAAYNIQERVYAGNDYQEVRKLAYDDLEPLFQSYGEKTIADAEEIASDFIDEMKRLFKFGGRLSGWSTGDKHLDEVTGGLNPGDYVNISARSGGGKSTRALNYVRHFMEQGRRILIFSMEMKKKMLAMKLVSDIGSIRFNNLKHANMNDEELSRMTMATVKLKESNLHIDESSGNRIEDIERKARQLKAKYGNLDMLVIDYIQRIRHDSSKSYAELTNASNRLKDLFMELDCCGLVLAQFKKNSKGIPDATDLRETGAIENDSDIIIFIHTPSQDMKPHKGMQTLQIFNKVRLGESCVKLLHNDLEHQRFVPVDGEYIEEDENPRF